MALVLAIESDPKQASILKRVVRERARAEITVVDSKDAAIAALSAHTPDLILVTALMSPRDEEELVAHLRTLGEEAGHLQTITIPLLASAGVADEDEEGFFKKKFRRKKHTSDGVGCDPWTFAEQVAGYVRAATETRAARQAELDYEQRRAAHRESAMDATAPPAAAATPIVVDGERAIPMSDLVFTQVTPPEVTPPRAPAEPVRHAAKEIAEALPEPIAPAAESVVLPEPAFIEPEPVEAPEPRGVPALDPAYFKTEPVLRPFEPTPPEPEPIIVPEPAVLAEAQPAAVPGPTVAAEPEPLVLPTEPLVLPEPEPVAVKPAPLEPEPLPALEPVLAIEPAPFEPELPEPVAFEAAFEPTVVESPQQPPDVPPEPVYQTPPERVFDSVVEEPPKKQSRWRKVLSREFGRKTQPETPAPPPSPPVPVYKPLKRLPPLAMWARTGDLLLLEPENVVTRPADDLSDLFDSLAVPPHILAVSYPRRPHVRRVRAA
jgi:CheY-like chemotaxis protein